MAWPRSRQLAHCRPRRGAAVAHWLAAQPGRNGMAARVGLARRLARGRPTPQRVHQRRPLLPPLQAAFCPCPAPSVHRNGNSGCGRRGSCALGTPRKPIRRRPRRPRLRRLHLPRCRHRRAPRRSAVRHLRHDADVEPRRRHHLCHRRCCPPRPEPAWGRRRRPGAPAAGAGARRRCRRRRRRHLRHCHRHLAP